MSTVKDGSSLTGKTFWGNTSPSADQTCLAVSFVSPPMQAGIAFATTDTIKCQFRVQESATNDNINRQPICLKVYSNDGTTLRATLKALGHYGPATTEWSNTTLTNRRFADGDTLGANYTTVAGDRLVLEVGGQVSSAGGASVTGTIDIGSGGAGTDLGENETDTGATLNPWFEISRTVTFLFTGTAAPSVGPATASASATFTKPTYAGTMARTVGPAAFSSSGTFTKPTYAGSLAKTVGGATLSGSATFTAGAATGTSAVTVGAATLAGSGSSSYNHPVGVLTRQVVGLWQRRCGSFAGKPNTPPYSEATAALTIGAATLSASGIASAPHPVVKITQQVVGLWQRRHGSFEAKGLTTSIGTASLSVGAVTSAGSATFVKPTYAGTSSLTVGHAAASASGTFTKPTYAAAAALVVGHATAAASGTFTKPTYAATAALTVGAATESGSASFAKPTYTGAAPLTVGHVTAAGSATFAKPTYTGTAALTINGADFAGTAIFATSVYVGSASLTGPHATLSGSAAFSIPEVTGAADVEIGGAGLQAVNAPYRVATAAWETAAARLAGVAPKRTGVAALTVRGAVFAAMEVVEITPPISRASLDFAFVRSGDLDFDHLRSFELAL